MIIIMIIIESQDPLNQSLKMIDIQASQTMSKKMTEEIQDLNTKNKNQNMTLNQTGSKEHMIEQKTKIKVMKEEKNLIRKTIKESKGQEYNLVKILINQEAKYNKELEVIIKIIVINFKIKITSLRKYFLHHNKYKTTFMLVVNLI